MSEYGEGYFLRGEGSNYHGYGPDRRWPATAVALASLVPPPAVLYEVGAATGWFLIAARRQGYEGYGCDLSDWAVSHAPKEARYWLQKADAARLPWTRPAHLIVSWELLEHVEEERLPLVFGEMLRLSWPGALWAHRIGLDGSDKTHRTVKPRAWWDSQFVGLGLTCDEAGEAALDAAATGTDWVGRHFVWRVPC